ncbi:MAG: CBS domain-containing protein [Deltaproteobacteria bacterium]|nr:CBS domain-containing protein [Deltaproteobacteria bacterium]
MVDVTDDAGDEGYYERPRQRRSGFDENLLREPLSELPVEKPLIVSPTTTVTDAVRAMQGGHRGCVLVTDDGTETSRLVGIFTERDVLLRIVGKGRNPAALPIREVMTPGPEVLAVRQHCPSGK